MYVCMYVFFRLFFLASGVSWIQRVNQDPWVSGFAGNPWGPFFPVQPPPVGTGAMRNRPGGPAAGLPVPIHLGLNYFKRGRWLRLILPPIFFVSDPSLSGRLYVFGSVAERWLLFSLRVIGRVPLLPLFVVLFPPRRKIRIVHPQYLLLVAMRAIAHPQVARPQAGTCAHGPAKCVHGSATSEHDDVRIPQASSLRIHDNHAV